MFVLSKGGFEERQSFEESDEENSRGSSSALSSITTLEELMDAATLSETVEKVHRYCRCLYVCMPVTSP